MLFRSVVDSDGGGKSSDWVFLRLRSADATCTLNAGSGLVVDVADRHGRRGLAQRLATKLCGVLPLTRHRLLGTEPSFEVVPAPGCGDGADAIILVLGLLSARVAEAAGLRPMAATAATFVQDVRLAAADAFADLREKVDGELSADRDVQQHLASSLACRSWLEKLVTKPAPPARRTRDVAAHGTRVLLPETDQAPVEPFLVLTWNVNGVLLPTSAQALQTLAFDPLRTTWTPCRRKFCVGVPTPSLCRSVAAELPSRVSTLTTR